jgi:hypothetical protein
MDFSIRACFQFMVIQDRWTANHRESGNGQGNHLRIRHRHDSVAGWIGSYGGGDSPSDIQRGIFASEVSVPRLLRLLNEYKRGSHYRY